MDGFIQEISVGRARKGTSGYRRPHKRMSLYQVASIFIRGKWKKSSTCIQASRKLVSSVFRMTNGEECRRLCRSENGTLPVTEEKLIELCIENMAKIKI